MLSESIKTLQDMYGEKVPLHTLLPITMDDGFKCLVEKLTEGGKLLVLYPRKFVMLETGEAIYGFNFIVGYRGYFKHTKGHMVDFEDDSIAKEMVVHNSRINGDAFETNFGRGSLALWKEHMAKNGNPNKIQPIGSFEECRKREEEAKKRAKI